jgi:hypothetical protein
MTLVASIPQLEVELDGESLAATAAATLEEVRVQHRLSQPSLCELTFVVQCAPDLAIEFCLLVRRRNHRARA